MNAIVLGAAGQLGSELVRLIGKGSGVTRDEVSVTDQKSLDDLLSSRRPELVFNCAAYNAVDRAETERDLAYAINSEGPAKVALSCARHGIRLVHFSTNFVFDGALERPYVETDAPAPLSVYGSSKLEGEQRVLDLLREALVIRTSAVFGDTGSASLCGLSRTRRSTRPTRATWLRRRSSWRNAALKGSSTLWRRAARAGTNSPAPHWRRLGSRRR